MSGDRARTVNGRWRSKRAQSRRRTRLASAFTILSSVAVAAPLLAHHAFSAEFDATQPVKFSGKVVRMEWINPHTWIHVEVTEPAEVAGTWRVEGGPPNTLYRRGFTKASLEPGTVITVTGYRSKDGTQSANGRDVTLADGRHLFLGSSGTGAPRDGTDPTESAQPQP